MQVFKLKNMNDKIKIKTFKNQESMDAFLVNVSNELLLVSIDFQNYQYTCIFKNTSVIDFEVSEASKIL